MDTPKLGVRAYSEEDQKKHDAEAALDEMLKPMMTGQNRYMTGDDTPGNPVQPVVSDQLAAQKPEESAQPVGPDAYETEYAAATTPQEKAQVAAKHGDWQKAYGNAQNAIGEVRSRQEELERRLEEVRNQPPPQPQYQQPPPQQADPYQQFQSFQVVQPENEYDDTARKINEGVRNFALVLGQGLEQRYGQTIQQLQGELEGLRKMPRDYAVDPQTEARLVNELGIGNLPEWQQKQIVQRIAGTQTQQNTRPTTPQQTPQERTVQRAVNFVEQSDTTASISESPQSMEARINREYDEARARETDPAKKNKAGRDVLLRYGFKEVDDTRKLPPL